MPWQTIWSQKKRWSWAKQVGLWLALIQTPRLPVQNYKRPISNPFSVGWARSWTGCTISKFTGIDNTWQQEQDPNNTIEGNFGFFYANLTMKPHFQDLVFTCTGLLVEYSFLEIGDPATSHPPTALPVLLPASCSVHRGCEALGGSCCPADSGGYQRCCDMTALPTIATTVSPTTLSPTAYKPCLLTCY